MLLYIVILITIAAVFFIVIGFGRMMSMTEQERRLLERATGMAGKKINHQSGDQKKNKDNDSTIS